MGIHVPGDLLLSDVGAAGSGTGQLQQNAKLMFFSGVPSFILIV